jgi:hypothetical protein
MTTATGKEHFKNGCSKIPKNKLKMKNVLYIIWHNFFTLF